MACRPLRNDARVIGGGYGALAVLGLLLAASTWVMTFALAVPLHRRLNVTRDLDTMQRLVNVNGLRTAAWTAHGVLAVALFAG